MARTELILHLAPFAALEPDRMAVLRAVNDHGSISAGARVLDISYRRAWLVLDELNRIFRAPLVQARGRRGTSLTPEGRTVLDLYDTLCRKAEESARRETLVLAGMLTDRPRASADKNARALPLQR